MNKQHSLNHLAPDFVISAGTQVVLKVAKPTEADASAKQPGSVGIVIECPAAAEGAYLVQFADGQTVKATFAELSLRRNEVDDTLHRDADDMRQYIIYRCQVGSKAYGLARDDSDDDIRGIYQPPASLHWSLYALPEQIEGPEGSDEVYWELEKYIRLALKANPNVLETLWTPMVLEANDMARELRNMRTAFLSKHLYKTYCGYVLSQFRRMRNAVQRTGTYKAKHAMHLIRLLYCGIAALETGEIRVDVAERRDELLHIRDGGLDFEEVRREALNLDAEFQEAYRKTSLPEQPDYAAIDDFLIRARRQMV